MQSARGLGGGLFCAFAAQLGILFTASSVTLFRSYKSIPAGPATTLVYPYPIFVAVIMLIFKAYPTWQVWLSIAATVSGVVVLSCPGGDVTLEESKTYWVSIVSFSYLCRNL